MLVEIASTLTSAAFFLSLQVASPESPAALPSLYATLYMRGKTAASPPVNLTAAAIVLIVLGFVLSIV